MKKNVVFVLSGLFLICSVSALTNNFVIDSSKLSFSAKGKQDLILNNFNSEYDLSLSISSNDAELENEMIDLTKKTTYLLLGDFNNINESSEEYYKRHQEYLSLGTYNSFPKDSTSDSGYDESVKNYNYAIISGFAVPSLFLQFNDLNVQYSNYGDIRITFAGDLVISTVTLSNVKLKEESLVNPGEFDIVQTNLIITYYFLEVNGNYTLCYLFGETNDDLRDYVTEIENLETKDLMAVVPSYDSNLRQLYNFSKLDALDDDKINDLYINNRSNIVMLSSYYNNYVIANAHGFFIDNGLVVTTWSFLEESLINAQFVAIKDVDGVNYEIDGIVTANPDTDVVVLKLKNEIDRKIDLGNYLSLNCEDPVLSISSKVGVGLTVQKGILISNNGYIQSAITLVPSDEGSPLFDMYGNVIGMNTSKQVNSSVSLAINSDILKEIQNKFSGIDFDTIDFIKFEDLKEKFYYVKYSDEIVKNNIPKNKWNVYSKIGNISETIKLDLVKASYEDNIISLRYKNVLSDYIDGMQLASSFKKQLIIDGYSEVLCGTKKCVYENGKYKVIIMDEFNYLIIVMVKL